MATEQGQTGQYMIGWAVTKEILQSIQGKDVFSINETEEIGYSCRKINILSTYRYTKVILK